jgi:predicted Fe-Mo cluster-binding NifX family protein
MKIAIASINKEKESKISKVAGRAPYYLIFEDKELVEVIKNPFASGGGGAGFGIAKMLIDKNVELVIAGEFGENMKQALSERGLKFKEVIGKTVEEIL